MVKDEELLSMAKELGINETNLAFGLKKDEKRMKENIKKAYKLKMGGK